MNKRKTPSEGKQKKRFEGEESSSDEDEELDMVNVDFEFFAPNPDVDFHGLKFLIGQLLDADNTSIDVSALTNLILEQPSLGSTIKLDGMESDPCAFLTVLNLREHKDNSAIKTLTEYMAQRSTKNEALAPIAQVLSPSSDATVGFIFTERIINVPPQLAPALYKLIHEEIDMALKDGQPYSFTHYLILSKTYIEVDSKLDQEEARPQKKKKATQAAPETFYFHPEDECLHKSALAYGDYNLVKEAAEGDSDFKRAFQETGIKPQGHMILIEASKFEATVAALEEYMRD
ncbi:MAG: Mss4p nuclear export [Stictis urceolatum]|nr:Mss4p nuclear export [Stictis urceolata]